MEEINCTGKHARSSFSLDEELACNNGVKSKEFTLSWSVWQLLDSSFPTGGFAHSFGLEAATHVGMVRDSSSLKSFVVSSLENTGALLLPFVFVSNDHPSFECWVELDKVLNATITNKVTREASLAQGLALLRTVANVYSSNQDLRRMRAMTLKSGTVYGHHAVIFGVVSGILKLDSATAQRAYLYLTMRDMLSAATRLNIIGPLEAAAMQQEISMMAESILIRYANRSIQDACQVAPLLDVIHGCHDQLHSRLFRS